MTKDDKPDPNKIEFLRTAVTIYNGYKISKDGLSREEDVEVMKGIAQEEGAFKTGFKLLKNAIIGEQHKEPE